MLPTFKDPSQTVNMMQNSWKQQLDPMLKNPLNSISIVSATLKVGDNAINHGLGQKPQGWIITDINGAATIYRSAAFDPNTLTLNSSAACTVSIGVF